MYLCSLTLPKYALRTAIAYDVLQC